MTARHSAQERLVQAYQRLLRAEVASARNVTALAAGVGRVAHHPLRAGPEPGADRGARRADPV